MRFIELLKHKIESKKIKIDLNGHYEGVKNLNFLNELDMNSSFKDENFKNINIIFNKLMKGELFDKPFPLCQVNVTEQCPNCDEKHTLWFDGNTLSIKESCKSKLKPIQNLIYIPSGKLVLANYFPLGFEEPNENINIFKGKKETTNRFSRDGKLYHYVGNTSPRFQYQKNKDKEVLLFGNFSQYDDNDYEIENENILGAIGTELHWISAIDYDILKKRIELLNLKDEIDIDNFDIVEMKKGVYLSTSLYPIHYDENNIYSKLELIEEKEFDESFIEQFMPKDNHLDKAFIENEDVQYFLSTKYFEQIPNFSTYLLRNYVNQTTFLDSDFEDKWFNFKNNYIENVCNKLKLNVNKIIDSDFYRTIPVFDGDKMFLTEPKGLMGKYNSTNQLDSENYLSSGICYSYEIDKEELALILMIFKSMYEHQNKESMKSFFQRDSKKNVVLKNLLFAISLAFENIKQRDLFDEMELLFKEIKSFEIWDKIDGYSPKMIKNIKEKNEIKAMQLKAIDNISENDFIEILNQMNDKDLNNHKDKRFSIFDAF